MESKARFVDAKEHADVAVVVVTYRNASDIDRLIESLRREATANRLRVIIADNDSPDDTLSAARAHSDVIAFSSGGNLGYSGGINAAARDAGSADAVLVLNPDIEVEPGAIAAMRSRLDQHGVGVVVPMIVDSAGERTDSLRREPSILRGLGDALLGGRLRRRPGAFAEMIFVPEVYGAARRVDWATGAALMVSSEAAAAIGEWDERFFLYSEETDYFRRAREAGFTVWYEPAAVVRHAEGGSGGSLQQFTLLAVNRIRYFAKYHGAVATALFHFTAVLNEVTRARDARHRAILRTVLRPRSWAELPRATRSDPSAADAAARARGTAKP
ncbi:glycosyltransferase family 2 protein [Microbacterium sp. KHB019]|uniref:glycosyltransferase family 2 protein n=1 Tax=Microbacterium sp. KHB019 TaxID=3129770 RepID=UPI00307978A1